MSMSRPTQRLASLQRAPVNVSAFATSQTHLKRAPPNSPGPKRPAISLCALTVSRRTCKPAKAQPEQKKGSQRARWRCKAACRCRLAALRPLPLNTR